MSTVIARDADVAALFARMGVVPTRITPDSRRVRPGDAFAAFPGARTDGRSFIPAAIGAGASVVLWEAENFRWDPVWPVANAPVEGLASRLGMIADVVYGHPSQALWIVGVTGTNGKTSCSQWIAQCFDACGRPSAVIGTLGHGRLREIAPAGETTPDAARVHELLAGFRDAGVKAVAMEVSSHGLEQGRVGGVAFDVALFTNLTRDHLDYHGTMDAYGAAKARLFAWPGLSACVVNVADPFGVRLAAAVRERGARLLTYGTPAADLVATNVEHEPEGIALRVATPWGAGEVSLPVAGEFNVQNALGVLGVLLASDVSLGDALTALARIEPPAGRMQRLGGGTLPLVVVDYAHTPDALQQALAALRPGVGPGRELACVFGCGGDRDAGKRAPMGAIAGRLADRVIVTNDNPRSEDAAAIAAAIVAGIRETSNRRWEVELDRQRAIESAIEASRPGDVVLIAGKGHEAYQDQEGIRREFSDARVAAAALAAWSAA